MIIVGIDPGKTTGLCAVDDDGQIHGAEARQYAQIAAFIDKWKPDRVVVEDFVGGRGAVDFKSPCKVLGVVEYICQVRQIPMTVQTSAILFRYHRFMDLMESRHVGSAYCHIIHYLSKDGGKRGSTATQPRPNGPKRGTKAAARAPRILPDRVTQPACVRRPGQENPQLAP